ncbi:serine O-acetyltransferase [Arthrobacter sp. MDT3-24]
MHSHDVNRWVPWLKFKYPELHYQRTLRLVELLSIYENPLGRLAWGLARLRLARLGAFYGISIPPGVFGRGLSIAHIGNIVVNNKVRVGRYCRIHSGTNLGEAENFAPQIGHSVYIGPGAVLFGNIKVGDNSVIGANSVVTKDVPSNVVVAGAPAQIIRDVGSNSPMPGWMHLAPSQVNHPRGSV